MGVNSLWEIVGPAARPVRLEALTRKKLAVDASIWIYQFLKAVRDSQGNALSQSHIVGFFRRICKLLYFGIQPVFVFDGGAPALKRETIRKRKEKREANQESLHDTAQRLLAINVQRQGEKVTKSPSKSKRFLPRDEYHLPDLKRIRVDESDDRLMPEEEFNAMTQESFDVVDGIDINTIDPTSERFANLPMPTQYMILSHLRLKSRLRMGFSKEQLEGIFNDSMDFSKFQIQQVQKRNFYTQKLMDVSGMGEDGNATRRIAGEKDRQYALVRTDNGWSLSLGEDEDQNIKKQEDDDDVVEINTLNSHIGNIKKELESKTIVIPDSEDSDDDFEDIPLRKEEHEDDQFNKAVIESIYDQYKNGGNGKELSTQDQLVIDNEDDLRRAIEMSKQDLQKMKDDEIKTRKEVYKETEPPHNGNNIESDLVLEESLLFGAPSSAPLVSESSPMPEPKEPIMIEEEEEAETEERDIEEVRAEETGSEAAEREKGEVEEITDDSRKTDDPIVINESTTLLEVPPKKEQGFHSNALKDLEEIEMIIDEKEADTDEPESKPGTRKEQNSVPVWFGGDIDKNVYYNDFKEPELQKDEKEIEDEEAGLIPWDEAKNYFDRDKKAEDDEEEDVIVVEKETTEEPNNISRELEEQKLKDLEQTPDSKELVLDYVFVDGEDEIAEEQLISEEKDHEMLKRDIASYFPSMSRSTITEEQLLQERLQKQKRDSDEVTQNMVNDIKELLRRFGIPFITAPMEAEAQCVELLKLKLVDGIVTDDSDSFLFGGDRIYKNMFNQKQYVECYLQDDLTNRLGLDQKKLIELGLLLGSDYTDGIKGVGPVLAMEILAEFGSLSNFKDWFDKCAIGQADSTTSLKKNLIQRIKNNKLFLSAQFPDQIVFDAYKYPEVDHSDEQIKWGVPNLDQIRSFLMYNVGWTQERVDEVMVPLIKDMNRKLREGTQSSINEFFSTSHYQNTKELKLSKRIKAAANKLRKTA